MNLTRFFIIIFFVSLYTSHSNPAFSASSDRQKSSKLASAIHEDHLDTFIMDQGITSSSRATSALLFEAESALGENKNSEALRLGKMAEKLSPDSPFPVFFLSQVYWQADPLMFREAILHFIRGLTLMVSDFGLWADLGPAIVLLSIFSVLLSSIVFILYSLIVYAPAWAHQLSQHSIPYLNPLSSTLLFSILFLSPLMLGLPPLYFVFFSFLLFWRFYNSAEKGGIVAFLIGIGTTAWVLPFILTLLTARSSVVLDEMARNVQGDTLLTPSMMKSENISKNYGWESWFIRAVNEGKEGHYDQAKAFYQRALNEKPGSPRILNNLGNLSFYQQDYAQARKYYQEAIKVDAEFTSAHYNLGQVFREELLFEKGDRQFLRVRTISQNVAEAYAMRSARFPEFPVIEASFSKGELWSALVRAQALNLRLSEEIWHLAVGPVPLAYSPLFALFVILVLSLSTKLGGRLFSARPCAFCKKAICLHCAKRLYSYQACKRCRMEFGTIRKKSDYRIIEDAVRSIPAKLYPLFLLPGGGHLAARMTKRGLLFLICFCFLISSIWFEKQLVLGSLWVLHSERGVLTITLFLMLYFVVILDLVRMRKRRLWL